MQENLFNTLAKTSETIHLYTDGSCKGNPGPGGWAAVILLPEPSDPSDQVKPLAVLKGHELHTTNNRMEMTAVIEGLDYIREIYKNQKYIQIFSDSNLIVQTINKGWKKKMNQDLWARIDKLNGQLLVQYTWIKGHANNRWNEYCDRIAVKEANKAI